MTSEPRRSAAGVPLPADDSVPPTPPAVSVALAAGVTPIPFLAVYTVLFIVHGSVHPVHPPDVTSTQHGELYVGLGMLVLLVASITGLVMLLGRRRRWPHALVQLVVLVASVAFLLNSTVSGRPVSALVAVAAAISLVSCFAPSGWQHVGRTPPRQLARGYAAVGLNRRPSAEGTTDTPGDPSGTPPASG